MDPTPPGTWSQPSTTKYALLALFIGVVAVAAVQSLGPLVGQVFESLRTSFGG